MTFFKWKSIFNDCFNCFSLLQCIVFLNGKARENKLKWKFFCTREAKIKKPFQWKRDFFPQIPFNFFFFVVVSVSEWEGKSGQASYVLSKRESTNYTHTHTHTVEWRIFPLWKIRWKILRGGIDNRYSTFSARVLVALKYPFLSSR